MKRQTASGGATYRRERAARLALVLCLSAALWSSLAVPTIAEAATRQRIVFATGCCVGAGSVFVVDSDGKNVREIASEGSGAITDPTWSPGATQVAYSRLRYAGPATGNTEVRIVDADGSGNHAIASFPPSLWALETTWSAKGRDIAFTLMQAPSYWGAGRAFSKIFLVAPDGSRLRPLTSDPVIESCAAWSPNGEKIAFVSLREGVSAVYVMRPDSVSLPKRVTPLDVSAGCPVWSPDGRSIAFTGGRVTDSVYADPSIWVVGADGKNARRLPAATWTKPSWSPDGRWLVYDFRGISIVRSDGSAVRSLTQLRYNVWEGWPVWHATVVRSLSSGTTSPALKPACGA